MASGWIDPAGQAYTNRQFRIVCSFDQPFNLRRKPIDKGFKIADRCRNPSRPNGFHIRVEQAALNFGAAQINGAADHADLMLHALKG
ncbi:hypothetical protein FQZ97_927690 [compost metagenome]